ncbi:cell division inhibitor SepF [Arcanobacterium pluranimalium]|uniref:cell division protein SepF n=1 Tax=Arcanobacterium pluranimalium TaxID=108028 RepID=UPI00195894BB|nr:cell division protein SepF [Arcanobacterium pluranimalium]MBM7825589.1 cell division inhibitor SepF [Arcanobacterium pluranimalium]
MGFLDRINQKAAVGDEDFGYEDGDFVDYADEEYFESDDAQVTPIRSVANVDIARIVTVWVSSYKDIKDFAVEFRNGLPVILNLSEAADGERARIVDFALGLCFGLEGVFSRISDDVFLLTPHSVSIDSRGSETEHDFAR